MATFPGNSGVVEVGGTAVGEVKSFNVTETMDTAEDTAMGDASRTHITTLKSWEGSVEAMFDDTDAIQESLTIGASITIDFLPEGAVTGSYSLTGTATVTSIETSNEIEAPVSRSFSFQGNGDLTVTTHA